MGQSVGRTIAEKYQEYWFSRTVVRSGVDDCGATQHVDGKRLPLNAVEDDLEHEALISWLLQMVLMYYPDLLSAELKERLVRLALIHDVVENESGDKNDDGMEDVQEKAHYETRQMARFLDGLPKDKATEVLHDFQMFSEVKTWTPDMETVKHPHYRMIQILFMADKLSAVLSGMCYEMAGFPGDLRRKARQKLLVSEQDLCYIALTGSTLITDVWSAHFIDFTKWFKDFPVFFNIWKESYLSMRKIETLPKWHETLLKNKQERYYKPLES